MECHFRPEVSPQPRDTSVPFMLIHVLQVKSIIIKFLMDLSMLPMQYCLL